MDPNRILTIILGKPLAKISPFASSFDLTKLFQEREVPAGDLGIRSGVQEFPKIKSRFSSGLGEKQTVHRIYYLYNIYSTEYVGLPFLKGPNRVDTQVRCFSTVSTCIFNESNGFFEIILQTSWHILLCHSICQGFPKNKADRME